jgi:hypothetical protein
MTLFIMQFLLTSIFLPRRPRYCILFSIRFQKEFRDQVSDSHIKQLKLLFCTFYSL